MTFGTTAGVLQKNLAVCAAARLEKPVLHARSQKQGRFLRLPDSAMPFLPEGPRLLRGRGPGLLWGTALFLTPRPCTAPRRRDARKLVFSTEGISFPALRRVFSYLWTHTFFAAFVKT